MGSLHYCKALSYQFSLLLAPYPSSLQHSQQFPLFFMVMLHTVCLHIWNHHIQRYYVRCSITVATLDQLDKSKCLLLHSRSVRRQLVILVWELLQCVFCLVRKFCGECHLRKLQRKFLWHLEGVQPEGKSKECFKVIRAALLHDHHPLHVCMNTIHYW